MYIFVLVPAACAVICPVICDAPPPDCSVSSNPDSPKPPPKDLPIGAPSKKPRTVLCKVCKKITASFLDPSSGKRAYCKS
jgi:hypothetical protein